MLKKRPSRRLRKFLIANITLAILVSGCNLLPENKKIDYKSAGKLPPLEVPPDLTSPETNERFAIPDVDASGSATFSTYNSTRSGLLRERANLPVLSATALQNGIHIERSGTQRWLVVPREPAAVWPVIKEFWQDMGFLLKVEAPDLGIMETDWAENRAKIPQDIIRSALSTFLDSLYSTAERDKFRTRLEQDQSGATEIFISHRGMIEVLADRNTNRTIWQPRKSDPELEAEMLNRLMQRFGVDEERATAEIAASGATEERAFLDKTRKGILIIREPFDRAWRRVGLELDRIGFTVEDRDRSSGIYFVRYISPGEEIHKADKGKGLLSKLAFWSNDTDKDSTAEKYQIKISEVSLNSEVSVLNTDGIAEESETAKRILNLLYEQLK
ncbi:outer membrane protein assembly factor BamC [Nitrosomonas eutropha]|uniref:Beta-barrel assembly machine subunit BamC n=2 Tax=Nitrosomonas eutropha TaxID=916 RepID=A0ABX5M7R8_9PROT|nr:outer membrane protein assembly factor BamC [Nitrosomonas eutropha]ABI59004.1 NlpBDapX family lipoprotein [Nitrosomonas eutropha C91]PXV82234.1 Beta-barrel assembly machine subunit BamC [Nitrosomonas eutropha]SCX24678.1 Beta-barrel assembly machine subunit BamC [Nitrosomonas eutropha]SEJ22554.1 Beta-barrel assembly machine subunit BamC [Nitrosomonas eutropha]